MDSRNSRGVGKPGTAHAGSSRPQQRSQNRGNSNRAGVRKNSRGPEAGTAYIGGSTATEIMSSSGKGTFSVRTNEVQKGGFKNMPMGKTTEMFNPAPAQKDGFFVHKRGQGAYGGSKGRNASNDKDGNLPQQQQQMTMQQMAREGAAQAMASEEDDTTAMSDLNSLQNFSYYGRRLQDRNTRNDTSPVASDAVSMNYNQQTKMVTAPFNTGDNAAALHNKINRQKSGLGNTSADTMSDNVSSAARFYRGNTQGQGPDYHMEERMNDNLTKQFQPMFSEDKSTANRPLRNDPLLNSVSDFSQSGANNEGTVSRAQLFERAKETLMAQRQSQQNSQSQLLDGKAKTSTNFHKQNTLGARTSNRNSSINGGSGPRSQIATQNMTKTAQNFMPKKGTAAKVLPPKLPPRGAMSPALTNLKAKNLSSNKKNILANSIASQAAMNRTDLDANVKDNIYFAPPNMPTQKNTLKDQDKEVVYKRGARSISKRRESYNQNTSELNLTAVENRNDNSTLVVSRKNLLGDKQNDSKRNLLTSDSKISLGQNTEQRREKYVGSCRACQSKQMDGHDHSVSNSLDQRLTKFNQNFNSSGHCRKHNVMGCDKCSFGSSKGSRVSSLDSGHNLISNNILKKHRVAPRSEIGGPSVHQTSKIAKSVTRQFKRPKQVIQGARNSMVQQSLNTEDTPQLQISSRIRSLPRQESAGFTKPSTSPMNRLDDVRRSTKNAEVRTLTGQLMNYGKRGNRPNKNALPKPGNFTVSEVKMKIAGVNNKRNDSSDSRGMISEYVGARPKPGSNNQIPQFTRILSAHTNRTAISVQRQELQSKLQQKDHGQLLDKDIKKLADEWEGDPHDPQFWGKFEGENSQTQLQKKQRLKGHSEKFQQEDVLDKQSNVFKQLREQDEMTSNRGSMLGTQMNFGARASIPGPIGDETRRSNASFFTNTLQPGVADEPIIVNDEPIETEIDQNEYMFQSKNDAKFLASIAQAKRGLIQDPSQAVITDYDITDEVGQAFGASFRRGMADHLLQFREDDYVDKVPEDGNIVDDMKKQLQQQLLESKAPRNVDDNTSIQQQQTPVIFSGQTTKSQMINQSPMEMKYFETKQNAANAKVSGGGRSGSDATGGFPSANYNESKTKATGDQPSSFQQQVKSERKKKKKQGSGKDSEDADSFDHDDQKSQILKELDLMGEDSDNGGDDAEPPKLKQEMEVFAEEDEILPFEGKEADGDDDNSISEKSNDDEDDQRRQEIEKKTLANVMMYDDFLEAKTQKEIERQSQIGAMSPKSIMSGPKRNIELGGGNLEGTRSKQNQTQQFSSKAKIEGTQDDNDLVSKPQQETNALAENIRDNNYYNSRPKTRGEPIIRNLDEETPTKTGTAKTGDLNGSKQTFSARRMTHENSDTGTNAALQNKLTGSPNVRFPALNSTQRSPANSGPAGLLRSPDKRGATLQMIQSKGIITNETSNQRSGANITNFASSLREDDLMISSSQVDPREQQSMRANSKLGSTKGSQSKGGTGGGYQLMSPLNATDHLAIQEESSSLKTVSPLTENSMSRKSHNIMGASPINQQPKGDHSNMREQPLPLPQIAAKKGLPPKSPFVIKKEKMMIQEQEPAPTAVHEEMVESVQDPAHNYISFAGDQVKQSDTFVANHDTKPVDQYSSSKKPELGSRNPDVQNFLAFEDSDDDIDFGGVVCKNKEEDLPYQNNKIMSRTIPVEEQSISPKNRKGPIKLSPPRQSSLAKTPSAALVNNAQFLRSNPTAMPQLTPFENLPQPVAKTPNTGISSAKLKALNVAQKMQTAQVPPMPPTRGSIEETSVNEQLNQIDYNQSNDGMSASFYRQHDQWHALQANKEQSITQPPLRSQNTNRSNRSQNRGNFNRTEDVNIKSQIESKEDPQQQTKIVNEAVRADQKVKELRNSVQALPKQQGLPPTATRNEELRQSNMATPGYQRPQGYVKKALLNSSLDVSREGSLGRSKTLKKRADTPDKFIDSRDGSQGRTPNFRGQNTSVISDSKGKDNTSTTNAGSKKKNFFAKNKGSIAEGVIENLKKREERSDSRGAAVNRLYGQETIASILKRNPELYWQMKAEKEGKKPPPAPAKKKKKKVVKPPTPEPEPPREDPPEEPLPQSPRALQLPIEASLPDQDSMPTNNAMPMRLPEEPPAEPSAFIMPNLFCPVDPDTPYNYEIEPRGEEQPYAPLEPLPLRQAIEPEEPAYPERMIKMSTEEMWSEKIEEPELFAKLREPDHDDEPMLEYPKQTWPMLIPPMNPKKFEPDSIIYPDEPEAETLPVDEFSVEKEPQRQFMTPADLERTNEFSVQCDGPQADEEEESKDQHNNSYLETIDEEPSDEDNFSMHSCEANNKVNVGIQTNEAHFRNVVRTDVYQKQRQERIESTDWALSPIFDEILFAKEKKTIGGRKLTSSIGTQMEENCGNQVEERQILQETSIQILSQIECEYNVDQLKRKMTGTDNFEDERLTDLYRLGLNTLEALMLGLRLEKEWEFQTKCQYSLADDQAITDPDETIKLLTRNKKMYEAKTLIQRLLKMTVQRDKIVQEATKLDTPNTKGGTTMNIPLRKPQPMISKESMAQIKRLSTRITSQINTLQEEHRIFRRPFILRGCEYLEQMQNEGTMLEDLMSQKFYVDESGTTGANMSNSFKSSGDGRGCGY